MSQPILRQLGCTESPFASYAENGQEKQLAQAAAAVAKFSTNFEEESFQSAIKQSVDYMRIKYAALKCGIQKSSEGQFHFVKSSTNELNYRFLKVDSENDAWAHFQSEATKGIPEFETLLYRVTLIQITHSNQYFIIANVHHSLADGFVYDRILGEILSVASDIVFQNKTTFDNQIDERPLIAPIENFFLSDLSRWSFFKLVLRMTWRSLGRGKAIYAIDDTRKAPWTERQSVYNRSNFAPDKLGLLKHKTRSHKTTVNGAIAAAMIFAFEKLIQEYPEKSVLRVAHAVDLRRRLPSNKDLENNLFCAASGVNTYHEIGQLSDFWKLAADVRNNLHNEIEVHRTPWRVLFAMKEALNLFDYADGPFSGRSETLGISNIGAVKSCQDCQSEQLQIDSVYIAGSIQIVGSLISAIVTTINDTLCFSFMACEPLIHQEELDQFAKDVIQLLEES
ncbi:MAG: hypothetical protein JKY19_00975 [Alcanivoracaceae bacterium]|nr:hypothetical protein [Alcanivoracaceae bacterium]